MAKNLCRAMLALAILWVAAVVAFRYLHYDKPPSFGTAIGDFHHWVKTLGGTRGETPPPAPPPQPEPEAAAPEPPPPEAPPAPVDEVDVALNAAETKLREAEEKSRTLRDADRGDDFDASRTQVLIAVGEVIEVLNVVLDDDPEHRRANVLYTRAQNLRSALRKL
jgi:hypothetical protein